MGPEPNNRALVPYCVFYFLFCFCLDCGVSPFGTHQIDIGPGASKSHQNSIAIFGTMVVARNFPGWTIIIGS